MALNGIQSIFIFGFKLYREHPMLVIQIHVYNTPLCHVSFCIFAHHTMTAGVFGAARQAGRHGVMCVPCDSGLACGVLVILFGESCKLARAIYGFAYPSMFCYVITCKHHSRPVSQMNGGQHG
jgi:hypothetical protein